jgi:tetratricopeptide (TPR) repeat protein
MWKVTVTWGSTLASLPGAGGMRLLPPLKSSWSICPELSLYRTDSGTMAAIEHSRELFDQGYYPQYVELLKSSLATKPAAEAFTELAQVYLFLGHANKALDILNELLQANVPVKPATRRLGKMLVCFARCLCSATFHDVLNEAYRTYKEIPRSASDKSFDTEDVSKLSSSKSQC